MKITHPKTCLRTNTTYLHSITDFWAQAKFKENPLAEAANKSKKQNAWPKRFQASTISTCQATHPQTSKSINHSPKSHTHTSKTPTITMKTTHTHRMEAASTLAVVQSRSVKRQRNFQKVQGYRKEISNEKDRRISTRLRNWTAKTMHRLWRNPHRTKTNKITSSSVIKTQEHHLLGTLITSPEKARPKSATISWETYYGNEPYTNRYFLSRFIHWFCHLNSHRFFLCPISSLSIQYQF